MTTLELDALQAVRGGEPLSEPVTFTAVAGSVVALTGPNGAGKSSLLSAIARTGVGFRGTVRVDGADLGRTRPRARARSLALLAQDSHGVAELRVRELVAIGARAGAEDASGAELSERIDDAIEVVGIRDLASRRLGTLSGGQRQLAQLARVVAQRTPVVLLDEPAAALDLGHQLLVERIVAELSARGRIVVAAVHDLGFALTLATAVLLLGRDGRAHHGAPAEVLTPARIHDVYGVRASLQTTPSGRTILVPDEPVRTPASAPTPPL
ncbi:ABC transporter ATP-binding protein [Microbacterium gorillae]|uniref:ABC transporter ATP-binding protein n=1 Tax=Microbacterium gorillae TaxID=1231063 RepID=UPI00058CFB18|nr:ABC transporter ATP-binding protein [Microbacterium gorillae]